MIRLTIRRNGKDWVVKDFEDDKSLLDYMVDVHSELIPEEVYETIEMGHTVYSDQDEDHQDEITEDTGQDPWDGQSLVRWLNDDHDDLEMFTN